MKKLIKSLLILSLVLNGWVLHAATNYQTHYSTQRAGVSQLDFSLKDFKVETVEKNGKKYSVIRGVSDTQTSLQGYAALPFMHTTLQIAPDKNISVVSSGDYEEISLEYPLLPSRGTIYRNQDPATIPYEIAQSSVTDSWYPGKVAENADPFIFRDVRGANIYVYPFQYNAQKQTLRIYRNLKVEVTENNSMPINRLEQVAKLVNPTANEMYNSLFINYNQDSRFANQVGENGEMLVLYTSRDATAIQPYINWKREKGFKVTATQVSTGTDVTATIKSAYTANKNLLYVQLVGDWADIKSPTMSTMDESGNPTDPMMGCVVGTDKYPELIIGRFSCSSAAQLTVQVDKTINYEKNPDTNSSSNGWYKRALGIASEQGAGSGDDGEADYVHMGVIKNSKLLKYTYTTVNEAYQSAPITSATTPINAGLSLINYCGHGDVDMFVTTGYDNSNIAASTNGNKLPFIFSVACVNGKFQQTTGDCFAEAWLKKSGGGAVATLMSTINQPWQPPMRGQDYFNDIIKGGYTYSGSQIGTNTTAADQRTTFGSIALNGTVLMLAEDVNESSTIETIQTWTTFGDASLQIRTDVPKVVSVTPQPVVAGQAYSLTVTANGSPLKNAMVCLYQNGNVYSALTNSSGVASITHSITTGTAKLTVTAYNTTTYQGDVSVGGASGNPTVAITAPVDGVTIKTGDIVAIKATAADNAKSVAKVEFFIDGVSKGTDDSAPYEYSWNTTGGSNGNHTIKTVVTDNENKSGEHSITVKLDDGSQPPVVEVIFKETFETLQSGWSGKDADGDGKYWAVYETQANAYEGVKYAASYSWENGALTPDNYMITPAIQLPATATDAELSFYVGALGQNYFAEHYQIAVKKSSEQNWTPLTEETLAARTWKKVTLALGAYAGESINIAFRHFNCQNMYALLVDNIEIKGTTSGQVSNFAAPTNLASTVSGSNVALSWTAPVRALSGYNIYRNNVKINSSPVTQTSYADNGLGSGQYTYTVKAVYTSPDGESAASNSINVTVGTVAVTVSNNPPAVNVATIRTPAEFEPVKTVVLQWDYNNGKRSPDIRNLREYNNLHNFLVKNIQLAGAKVLILVDDSSVQNQITSFLQSNGTPLTNVTFKIAATNSIWCRDYSATAIYYGDNKQIGLVDWEYNRVRPQDDDSPLSVAAALNQNLFRADENSGANKFVGTGGNFMTDGFGLAISSKLIVDENNGNETNVKNIIKKYMGIDRYALMNTLPYDEIHHIDMHMKLLDEETILVGQYPPNVSDGPAIEANLQSFLTNFKTVYGKNFRVVRMPMLGDPANGDKYQTYTNSLIVNNYVLVPIYGVSTDAQALQIYRDAMPGYTVVGFNCSDIIALSGAIHCITHEVNQDKNIRIKHPRITTDVASNLVLNAELWSNEAVTSVKAYVKFNGQSSYSEHNMTLKDGVYTVSVPCATKGEARYYIKAQSASAVTCKPQAAATGGYYVANITETSSISEDNLPLNTELYQNYPNPFNPETSIKFFNNAAGIVKLTVYNNKGEEVAVLTDKFLARGMYSFNFNAQSLNSGLYFYKLQTADKTISKKMLMLK